MYRAGSWLNDRSAVVWRFVSGRSCAITSPKLVNAVLVVSSFLGNLVWVFFAAQHVAPVSFKESKIIAPSMLSLIATCGRRQEGFIECAHRLWFSVDVNEPRTRAYDEQIGSVRTYIPFYVTVPLKSPGCIGWSLLSPTEQQLLGNANSDFFQRISH